MTNNFWIKDMIFLKNETEENETPKIFFSKILFAEKLIKYEYLL